MRLSFPVAQKKARIEIIPLIDIIFFLLATFVMVSMSMKKNLGVPVRLPSASTAASEDRTAAVAVTVTAEGDFYLDKEAVDAVTLKTRLERMHAENPDVKVFVNGDKQAAFGRAVEVLDQVRELGITKIVIQTRGKQ